MTILFKNQLISTLIVLAAVLVSGSSLAADFPLQEKLQQCEAAFEKMHSGELAQKDAWKVRREHKKLVSEILVYLNRRNHHILESEERTLSSEEVLENLVAMGSLLEMLATENLASTDEWGYPLTD